MIIVENRISPWGLIQKGGLFSKIAFTPGGDSKLGAYSIIYGIEVRNTIRFVPFLKAQLVPVGLRHGQKNLEHYYKDRNYNHNSRNHYRRSQNCRNYHINYLSLIIRYFTDGMKKNKKNLLKVLAKKTLNVQMVLPNHRSIQSKIMCL